MLSDLVTLTSLIGKVTWINLRKGSSFSLVSIELYCGSVTLRSRNSNSLPLLYFSCLFWKNINNLHSIPDQWMLFESYIWALARDNSTHRFFFFFFSFSNLSFSSLCCLQAWTFWHEGLLAQPVTVYQRLYSCFKKLAPCLWFLWGWVPQQSQLIGRMLCFSLEKPPNSG